jgi:hypothetical protein
MMRSSRGEKEDLEYLSKSTGFEEAIQDKLREAYLMGRDSMWSELRAMKESILQLEAKKREQSEQG